MELFSFYQIATSLFSLTEDEKLTFLWGPIVGGAIWLAFFLLQGVGVYAMAKRQGMEKRWFAFTPFANIYYMGKLAGSCEFFGHKMKRPGLYAMIGQIVSTLFTFLYIFSECYLYYNHGWPIQTEGAMGYYYHWNNLSGFANTVFDFYEYGGYFFSIITLVSQVLTVILLIGLYQKYSPKNYRWLAVLSFMLTPARFITLFALRNRQAVDYAEYVRRQREAYARYRQQYYGGYGNPYNNPYGNPYGGGNGYGSYGNGNYGAPNQPPAEEPFGEFSSGDKSAGDKQSSGNDEVDELFN